MGNDEKNLEASLLHTRGPSLFREFISVATHTDVAAKLHADSK
jgi:hypothetical protein